MKRELVNCYAVRKVKYCFRTSSSHRMMLNQLFTKHPLMT